MFTVIDLNNKHNQTYFGTLGEATVYAEDYVEDYLIRDSNWEIVATSVTE